MVQFIPALGHGETVDHLTVMAGRWIDIDDSEIIRLVDARIGIGTGHEEDFLPRRLHSLLRRGKTRCRRLGLGSLPVFTE
jgi:hypothetical protein